MEFAYSFSREAKSGVKKISRKHVIKSGIHLNIRL